MRAVLLTNVYLSLTADPVAFAQLQSLLEEAENNAALITQSLMFAKQEVTFGLLGWAPFRWQRSLLYRMDELVKYINGSLVPLQESVFVFSVGASSQWTGTISSEQARLSVLTMEPLHAPTTPQFFKGNFTHTPKLFCRLN